MESTLSRDKSVQPVAGGFGGQALRQGGEVTGLPAGPESVRRRSARPEPARRLTPPPGRPEPPDHRLEPIPKPLGVPQRTEPGDERPGVVPGGHDRPVSCVTDNA